MLPEGKCIRINQSMSIPIVIITASSGSIVEGLCTEDHCSNSGRFLFIWMAVLLEYFNSMQLHLFGFVL